MTITSHHTDAGWNIKRFVLQTRVSDKVLTGEHVGALLSEACTEWEITDKNPVIVTDNTRNMIAPGAEAQFRPHKPASQKGFGGRTVLSGC